MYIPFAYSNNFTHSLLYFLYIALYIPFTHIIWLAVKILYALYPNKVLFLSAFCCALCFVRKISPNISQKLFTNSQIPPDIFLDSQFSTSINPRQQNAAPCDKRNALSVRKSLQMYACTVKLENCFYAAFKQHPSQDLKDDCQSCVFSLYAQFCLLRYFQYFCEFCEIFSVHSVRLLSFTSSTEREL